MNNTTNPNHTDIQNNIELTSSAALTDTTFSPDGLILKDVFYQYPGNKKEVLRGINAHFPAGKVTAVCGRSGAGKSTLLYLLAGLDVPKKGDLIYRGRTLTRSMLDDYRRNETATIAQSYLLFPTRTALENVEYPLRLAGMDKDAAKKEAHEHLLSVGIGEELHNRLPARLSGGEQQRVAIARCLATHSNVIAADEPTGNLDEENAEAVVELLLELAHTHNKTIIVVTHDSYVAERCDIRMRLKHGQITVEM